MPHSRIAESGEQSHSQAAYPESGGNLIIQPICDRLNKRSAPSQCSSKFPLITAHVYSTLQTQD